VTPRELFDLQTANRWTVAASTAAQRVERLERLRGAIGQRRDRLCAAIRADFGKHAVETELTEVLPVMEEIALVARHLRRWVRPQRVSTPMTLAGGRSEIRYEPKGLVLILSPWNYPFLLAIDPLVAAVAAGNCVILRPSDKTPRTTAFLHELVSSVFPENEAAVVVGGHEVADALIDLPFDHVFFTGSTAVGRKVMTAAARHLSSVTLELGGKSPVIVDETADLDAAGARVAWGKFINAGQTCVAPDYALVHEAVADGFVEALVRAIARSYGADEASRAASADLPCMVDGRACDRLEGAIRGAVNAGARVIVGGMIDAGARRIAPTVVTNVAPDSPLMAEEIFGPVLPILTFRGLDEAVAMVRAMPKPLALYVFSRRQANIDLVLGGTTAGGTCVNHVVMHLANPHLPFGGVGDSGMGHYHGRFGFEAMSHARAVYRQVMPSGLSFLFPPYTARSEKLMRMLRRITG
jgi:aldehyde dehydrogenase (NAD+)